MLRTKQRRGLRDLDQYIVLLFLLPYNGDLCAEHLIHFPPDTYTSCLRHDRCCPDYCDHTEATEDGIHAPSDQVQ